jgi:methionine aminopeptidase
MSERLEHETYDFWLMIMSHSRRSLEDGDIVNIDITVYFNGYHGDTSRTFLVGDVVSGCPETAVSMH